MLIYRHPIGTCAYMGGIMAVPEEFTWSWGQMIAYNYEYVCQPGEIVWHDKATASYHSTARNDIVKRFMGDRLLMLDCDHKFEPDLFARMLAVMKKYDLDVLTGLYRYRIHPHLPTIYKWKEEGLAYEPVVFWPQDQEIVQIDCAGGGCLMVHRRVFHRIKAELKEDPFDIIHPYSEDFSFFNRLRKLGIKAYLCPAIESWHLGVYPVTEDLVPPNLRPQMFVRTSDQILP